MAKYRMPNWTKPEFNWNTGTTGDPVYDDNGRRLTGWGTFDINKMWSIGKANAAARAIAEECAKNQATIEKRRQERQKAIDDMVATRRKLHQTVSEKRKYEITRDIYMGLDTGKSIKDVTKDALKKIDFFSSRDELFAKESSDVLRTLHSLAKSDLETGGGLNLYFGGNKQKGDEFEKLYTNYALAQKNLQKAERLDEDEGTPETDNALARAKTALNKASTGLNFFLERNKEAWETPEMKGLVGNTHLDRKFWGLDKEEPKMIDSNEEVNIRKQNLPRTKLEAFKERSLTISPDPNQLRMDNDLAKGYVDYLGGNNPRGIKQGNDTSMATPKRAAQPTAQTPVQNLAPQPKPEEEEETARDDTNGF